MPQPIAGLKKAGNINLWNRPHITNPDGSHSTVNSEATTDDNGDIPLYPGMNRERLLSPQEAVQQYQRTGENLGTFDTIDNQEKYAQQLHEDYAQGLLDPPLATSRRGVDPNTLGQALQGLLKYGPYVDPYAVGK